MQISGVVLLGFFHLYAALRQQHYKEIFTVDQLSAISIYWTISSFLLCLVIVLFLMRPDMKKNLVRNDVANIGEIILWSIVGFFMAFFAQGIANVIEIKLLGIKPGSENTQDIMSVSRAFPLFMIIPMFVAPILEEVIFRKIIFGTLYKRSNFFIAALLSALIFGIIHGEPEHLLVYASMGLVFAFLYVKTKRILVPIFVHMALNSITVIRQYSLSPEEIQKMLDQLQMISIGG